MINITSLKTADSIHNNRPNGRTRRQRRNSGTRIPRGQDAPEPVPRPVSPYIPPRPAAPEPTHRNSFPIRNPFHIPAPPDRFHSEEDWAEIRRRLTEVGQQQQRTEARQQSEQQSEGPLFHNFRRPDTPFPERQTVDPRGPNPGIPPPSYSSAFPNTIFGFRRSALEVTEAAQQALPRSDTPVPRLVTPGPSTSVPPHTAVLPPTEFTQSSIFHHRIICSHDEIPRVMDEELIIEPLDPNLIWCLCEEHRIWEEFHKGTQHNESTTPLRACTLEDAANTQFVKIQNLTHARISYRKLSDYIKEEKQLANTIYSLKTGTEFDQISSRHLTYRIETVRINIIILSDYQRFYPSRIRFYDYNISPFRREPTPWVAPTIAINRDEARSENESDSEGDPNDIIFLATATGVGNGNQVSEETQDRA